MVAGTRVRDWRCNGKPLARGFNSSLTVLLMTASSYLHRANYVL